jgi:Ca-activated chloride channel family protein
VRNVTRLVAGGLAVLSLAATPAAAQRTPVFRVGLDLVNVTVTVRDGRGGLVSDLDAGDFVVREDGRVQPVHVFGAAAGQVHAGERAPRTADLHCTRCGEIVHVAEGQTVPECPHGHRTFDVGEREELALNLGMLFDTSQSMRKDLKLSQESAIRFLDAIPRARDLLLIFFDRDIRLSRYNSENQQGIFERILETKGEGYTALYDAIAVYLSRVAETPGRKVLVVFTDGDDTTSQVPPHEVQRLVRSSDVTVYPVAFPGEYRPSSADALRARSFLHSLAELSGGRVFQPTASRELAGIYQSILDELGTQYVLGYVSDNPKRDGRFRRITVELKRPGLKLRHRPGYDAPRDEPPKPPKRK